MEPGEPDTPRAERPDLLTDVLASIRALVSAETAARIDENEAEREDVVMLTAEMRVAEPTRDGELLAEGLAGLRSAGAPILDEEALRGLINAIVREELQGELGERISRNLHKLVRREVAQALEERRSEAGGS